MSSILILRIALLGGQIILTSNNYTAKAAEVSVKGSILQDAKCASLTKKKGDRGKEDGKELLK